MLLEGKKINLSLKKIKQQKDFPVLIGLVMELSFETVGCIILGALVVNVQ